MSMTRRDFVTGLLSVPVAGAAAVVIGECVNNDALSAETPVNMSDMTYYGEMDHAADAASYYSGDQWSIRERYQMEASRIMAQRLDNMIMEGLNG